MNLVEISVVDERYQAVLAVVQDGWKVVQVADRLGVARQTVHNWIARYEAGACRHWPIAPIDRRPGGHVGFVGVAYGVQFDMMDDLFFTHVHWHGGPAPVRQYLPQLVDLIWDREIDPGKVFDLELPLEKAAEGYEAMDQRRAIKVPTPPIKRHLRSGRGRRHADR